MTDKFQKRMWMNKIITVCFVVLFLFFVSCEKTFTPKPKGYFRIALPSKKYKTFDQECPFTFEIPEYSLIHSDIELNTEPCWYNIDFPLFRATLHLSYKAIHGNVYKFIEESRALAFKHTIKADAINEDIYQDPVHQKYGVFYDIKGNAASSIQFFVTDSTQHFLRGALYFNNSPNKDSIAPVLQFILADIDHLVETLEWVN